MGDRRVRRWGLAQPVRLVFREEFVICDPASLDAPGQRKMQGAEVILRWEGGKRQLGACFLFFAPRTGLVQRWMRIRLLI